MDESSYSFFAEYADDSNESCLKCNCIIYINSLRIKVMVQSTEFDGRFPVWYHIACFFSTHAVKSTDEIGHFCHLRYEDQKLLLKKVDMVPAVSEPIDFSKKSNISIFSIEYAKSNVTQCVICRKNIEKDEIRIFYIKKKKQWHHINCFSKVKDSLGFNSSNSLQGLKLLSPEDQKLITQKFPSSKRKREVSDDEELFSSKKVAKEEESKILEEIMQDQSTAFYSYRDALQKLNKQQICQLLEANHQHAIIKCRTNQQLDHLADCLTFGVLKSCPQCNGQIILGSEGYICTGHRTMWTKCQYTVLIPNRVKLCLPKGFFKDFSFLLSCQKWARSSRIFHQNFKLRENLSFDPEVLKRVFLRKLNRTKTEAEKLVRSHGGKIARIFDAAVTCIITTREDYETNTDKKMHIAKIRGVFVIAEEFLDEKKNSELSSRLEKHLLYPSGLKQSDSFSRIATKLKKPADPPLKPKKDKFEKLTVLGNAAVDPKSGLRNKAIVLEENGVPFNAVLTQVDVQRGINSYFKLQALECLKYSCYYVFSSWGRIGTNIGNNKLSKFATASLAITCFKETYFEKTNNNWRKGATNFIKFADRFYELDIDYSQDVKQHCPMLKNNSKLAMPIQELICDVYGTQSLKKAMLEFKLDLTEMPLCKLSKKQINEGIQVLKNLKTILKKKYDEAEIIFASNMFYTYIPHDFGLQKPPLLDNKELLKSKIDMLNSLLNMNTAVSPMKTSELKMLDPIDKFYLRLKTDIEVLDSNSKEFKVILRYLTNTHGETHKNYSLDIEQVFKINRFGERKRYLKHFGHLHNRKLLWHGSVSTNYAGILSEGLCISPAKAQFITGYMFGKGIYFADMVSKSANYCSTSSSNPIGLLLLCEVALGNMYKVTVAAIFPQVPSGYDSIQGLGATSPDPKESIFENDVEVPLGKPISYSGTDYRKLLYNEYVVFDVNQVNIKYLLRVRFKWK